MDSIKGVNVLASNQHDRIGAISFYIDGAHYNLVVKLLSDRFGIQVRGGCVCAGTYGHYLLHVSKEQSHHITEMISSGDLSEKPGWIRWSIHPTNTLAEVDYIAEAIDAVSKHHKQWVEDYRYCKRSNEFFYKGDKLVETVNYNSLFKL
jgi:selenocysteine lyase/cysteine desulfurase